MTYIIYINTLTIFECYLCMFEKRLYIVQHIFSASTLKINTLQKQPILFLTKFNGILKKINDQGNFILY